MLTAYVDVYRFKTRVKESRHASRRLHVYTRFTNALDATPPKLYASLLAYLRIRLALQDSR